MVGTESAEVTQSEVCGFVTGYSAPVLMRPRSPVQPLKRQLLQAVPCWRTAPLNYHRFARNPKMRGLGMWVGKVTVMYSG